MPGPSEQGKFPVLHAFARAKFDAILTEPLPDEWKELLRQLHEREEHQSPPSDPLNDVHHKKKTNL